MAVLIPAWRPDARLRSLILHLEERGFGAVVVVDDGSGPAFVSLFDELEGIPSVTVLRQSPNLGKGSALKVGIRFVRDEVAHIRGIVTADADGQHAVADIVHVAGALSESGATIVLGTRRFTGPIPWRCRVGNVVTRKIFRLLTGVILTDTQSGLRGLPRGLFHELSQLPGERYEYEMVMLARLCRTGRRPLDVPIETLYLDDNASSHFRPVRDSACVLLALVKSSLRF